MFLAVIFFSYLLHKVSKDKKSHLLLLGNVLGCLLSSKTLVFCKWLGSQLSSFLHIMPRHHTSFSAKPSTPQLSYKDGLLSMGSCFAQNLGQQLQQHLYDILINPFGVLYNPSSISQSLQLLQGNYYFEEKDLLPHHDLWHSLQHHSSFSGTDKTTVLADINNSLKQARQHLKTTNYLFLTFGTAWVYLWKASGKVVSNCHHFPAASFERKRLSVQEIVTAIAGGVSQLKKQLNGLEVILTISPVRHLKDGWVENQVSKATLVLAVQELVQELDYCHYFPAYELLLDDLRDYRYYGKDLVHPNELAIEYIWQIFEQCHLAPQEQGLRKKVAQLQQAAQHKARQPQSAAHQQFLQQQLAFLEKLAPQLPQSGYQQLKGQFLAQVL